MDDEAVVEIVRLAALEPASRRRAPTEADVRAMLTAAGDDKTFANLDKARLCALRMRSAVSSSFSTRSN
jgi:hypothetical protein